MTARQSPVARSTERGGWSWTYFRSARGDVGSMRLIRQWRGGAQGTVVDLNHLQ